MKKLGSAATVLALAALTMSAPSHGGVASTTKPVTKELGDRPALLPSVSSDGRLVVFETESQLVESDVDSYSDIYLWNRSNQSFTRLSVAPGGAAADDDSGSPVISQDGKRVAFDSNATNLVANDTNEARDVFVRYLETSTTRRVSVSSAEAQAEIGYDSALPSISKTGKVIAFESYAPNLVSGDTNDYGDVFVRNLGSGTTRRVSVKSNGTQANGDSYYAAVDPLGLFVSFTSNADNLVGTDTNESSDVFLHHNQKTSRVSVNSAGGGGNSYSEDSALTSKCRTVDNKSVCSATVVFTSDASNLVGGDDNHAEDVFIRSLGKTRRVSINSDEDEGGQFESSGQPSISNSGRYVAFASEADLSPAGNDVNGFDDIYLRDRTSGRTSRISIGPNGPGNLHSQEPAVSATGKWVAFQSLSTTLDSTFEDNLTFDIFLRGPLF